MDASHTKMNVPEHAARASRTASKAVRRQQLIDAAIEAISKFGISGTTTNSVAKIAGLSAGLVNFHFNTKEALFEETLKFLAEEHRALWQKKALGCDQSASDRLLSIVDAEFHPQVCSRKKLTVWTAFYGETSYRKSYRQIMSGIDTERWESATKLCEVIIAEGGYKGISAEEVAETLEGLFDGFCLNILIYPGEFTRDDAKQRIRSFLALTFPDHFKNAAPACAKAIK